MEFDKTDTDGRRYGEITLPAGTFRTYEDEPYTARQVKQSPDEPCWFEPVLAAWDRGEFKEKTAKVVRNPKDKGILRKGPDGLYDVFYDMPLDEK